jgi:hypothetical protein
LQGKPEENKAEFKSGTCKCTLLVL